jgi:hypothetical protein
VHTKTDENPGVPTFVRRPIEQDEGRGKSTGIVVLVFLKMVCCLGPILILGLGTTASLSLMYTYRWYLMGCAVLLVTSGLSWGYLHIKRGA